MFFTQEQNGTLLSRWDIFRCVWEICISSRRWGLYPTSWNKNNPQRDSTVFCCLAARKCENWSFFTRYNKSFSGRKTTYKFCKKISIPHVEKIKGTILIEVQNFVPNESKKHRRVCMLATLVHLKLKIYLRYRLGSLLLNLLVDFNFRSCDLIFIFKRCGGATGASLL